MIQMISIYNSYQADFQLPYNSLQKNYQDMLMAFFRKIQIHLTSNDLNQTRAQTTKECIFQNTLCLHKNRPFCVQIDFFRTCYVLFTIVAYSYFFAIVLG